MVEDERDSNDELEAPRRQTYTPPDPDAVFTGSFPIIEDSEPGGSPAPIGPPEPAAPVLAKPRAATDPPVRKSMTDAEIMIRFQGGQAGTTGEMIAELERQVSLREDEEEAFSMWANLVRATRGEHADEIIRRERIIFDGGEPEAESPAEEDSVVAENDTAAETPPESGEEPQIVEEEVPLDISVAEPVELATDISVESDSIVIPLEPGLGEDTPGGGEDLTLPGDEGAGDVAEVSAEVVDQWPLQQKTEPLATFTASNDSQEDGSGEDLPVTSVTAGLLWMWAASLVPVVGIMAGAFLVFRGLGLWESLAVVAASGLVAGLVIAAGATRQKRHGQSTLMTARHTFGRIGNAVPSALISIIRITSLAVILLLAVSVALRVLELSGLWPYATWIAQLGIGVVVAAGIVVLGVWGGRVLRIALWVSAAVGALGLAALVVLQAPTLALAVPAWDANWLSVVGSASLVFSGLLILWGAGGGDLTDLRVGAGKAPVSLVTALGAIVPVAVMVWVAAWVSVSTPGVAVALVTDPIGALVTNAPVWYPAPALIVGVLPLVVLGAWILFSTGRGVEAIGVPLGRVPRTVIVSVVALGAVAAALTLGIDVARYVPDALITVGVVWAAWAGAFALDAVLTKSADAPVPAWRIAPLAGMVVAIALGLGLVSSSVSLLSWQGYFLPLLESAGLIDLAPAAPGVWVALLVSAVVTALASLGARARASTSDD